MSRLPRLGPRGEGWVAIQLLLLVAVAVAGLTAGGAWSGTLALATGLVGVVLMATGALLGARGLLDLGRSLTPLPYPRDGGTLVDTGVYGLVRHPMYGGLILTAMGWALVAASPLALFLAVMVAIFFELKSRREEMWLRERFAGYAAYMERTHRFVPWLY